MRIGFPGHALNFITTVDTHELINNNNNFIYTLKVKLCSVVFTKLKC